MVAARILGPREDLVELALGERPRLELGVSGRFRDGQCLVQHVAGAREVSGHHQGAAELDEKLASARMIRREERDGTRDEARGCGDVAAGSDCSTAGGRQPLAGPRRELGGVLTERSELLPVQEGLLEVVADDLVELARPLARRVLEPVGVLLVHPGPRLLRHAEICSVSNQNVAKLEAVLRGKDRPPRLDELLPREGHEAGADGTPVRVGEKVGDGAAPELLADHRCSLDHRALFRC